MNNCEVSLNHEIEVKSATNNKSPDRYKILKATGQDANTALDKSFDKQTRSKSSPSEITAA